MEPPVPPVPPVPPQDKAPQITVERIELSMKHF